MENLRKYLPKIDSVLILTIISYGIVYSYNVGSVLYYNLPISFIELGVNNITNTLISLCLLFNFYVVIIIDISKIKNTKNLLLIILFFLAFGFIVFKFNLTFAYAAYTVFLGSLLLLLVRKFVQPITLTAFIISYALFSSAFVGYYGSYLSINSLNNKQIVVDGKDKFVVLWTYQGNYVVTRLNEVKNQITQEYQLLPFADKKLVIQEKKLKLKMIKN